MFGGQGNGWECQGNVHHLWLFQLECSSGGQGARGKEAIDEASGGEYGRPKGQSIQMPLDWCLTLVRLSIECLEPMRTLVLRTIQPFWLTTN